VKRLGCIAAIAALLGSPLHGQSAMEASIRVECLETLPALTEALLKMQIVDTARAEYGALVCPETRDLHTRAAEAVYPFAVMFKEKGDKRYLWAAIALGNWLIRQQEKGGEWLETPWTWTGTTADQLLMMSLTYPIVAPHLSQQEQSVWKVSIKKAADYLVRVMNPDFATINYCATTPATLAVTNAVVPDPAYLVKARQLSRQVLSKMNPDGFIDGEAARVGTVKYGVDPAYEFDMSFWGLLLYARIANDTLVANTIRQAVGHHLALVYPNGVIDGSWGTRCYKWTTYGSKTADGSQILFSLLAPTDARCRAAALRNLAYLRTMIRDGVVGNGPQSFGLLPDSPCIYPTFARAKNLAMAIELGDQDAGQLAPLPSEQPGMFAFYPSVNIAVARTKHVMTTISGYGYVDQLNWGEGRYSQFPSGGSACNLWFDGYGLLQTSSPTRYVRGEVIHMPEVAEPIKPHTPRIEFADSLGYFTNLYDRFGWFQASPLPEGKVSVAYTGELRDARHLPGGVSYRYAHEVDSASVIKTVEVKYHDKAPEIAVVEPVIWEPGMEIRMQGDSLVTIESRGKVFEVRLLAGLCRIVLGENKDLQWQPFPALRCYPITFRLDSPVRPYEESQFERSIRYSITMVR
jgi:hypothetical protein